MNQLLKYFLFYFCILSTLGRLPSLTAQECECSDYYYDHGSPPYHHTTCLNISTDENVACFSDFLFEMQNYTSVDTAFHIDIFYSDIEAFPADIFVPFYVTYLVLDSCNVPEIPYSLLDPICFDLISLKITNSQISSIVADGFQNCSQIRFLDLSFNRLDDVDPDSFSQMPALIFLQLEFNQLRSFGGLEGLSNLREIFLNDNQISYVDKNAFNGMSKLRNLELTNNDIATMEDGTFDPIVYPEPTVYLEGNPFYCNCSLEWLQNWLNEHGTSDDPQCVAPVEGPLKTTNFCPTISILNTIHL